MSCLLSPTPKIKNAILKVWTRMSREERDSETCSDKADSRQFFSWDTQSWEGFGNVCYLLGILWMQVMKWYPDMASELATNWGSADFPIHCQNIEYYLFPRGTIVAHWGDMACLSNQYSWQEKEKIIQLLTTQICFVKSVLFLPDNTNSSCQWPGFTHNGMVMHGFRCAGVWISDPWWSYGVYK